MIRLGLVGYPLERTLPPFLFDSALQASGLEGEYVRYPMRTARTPGLRRVVQRMRAAELQGLTVAVPHQQLIIRLLDEVTPAASAIRAVNTVYLKDGRLAGENTDFAGFLADLRRWDISPGSSVVLGAGKAARAVAYALGAVGCKVTLASRRQYPARALAHQFAHVTAVPLPYEALRGIDADLVVNATRAGMFSHIDECAWPAGLPLPRTAAVYDLVYDPAETPLLQQAQTAGLKNRNGLGMLVEQTILAFRLWTGRIIPHSWLEDAIGQMPR